MRTAALAVALLVLGVPRVARADDAREDARVHYAKGLELAGQNGYEGALREFNAAYVISPEYVVLYNIGQAHVALGQAREAIDTLDRYLHDGGDRIAPARRTQVLQQLAWLHSGLPNPSLPSEAEAARVEAAAAGEATAAASAAAHRGPPRPGLLTVRCADPSLRLTLDGKHVDLTPSTQGMPVAPGPHRLVLTLPARRPTEQNLTISEGGTALVLCETLVPPPLPTGPPAPVGPPGLPVLGASNLPPTIHARTVGYWLSGLGVALGGTAVYLWKVDQDDQPAIGSAIAGASLLAGGVYLLLHRTADDEKTNANSAPRTWASVTPGGASWNGVW